MPMILRHLLFVLILLPLAAGAIPEEEKKRGCSDLASKVLPGLRRAALANCMEWATTECDRLEHQFNDSCRENSHSDNAIKYDMERGLRYCEAALMKRETHRVLCDGIRRECRENKMKMGENGIEGTCAMFRDDKDKRICVMIEEQADRIIAAEKEEREKCASMSGPPKPAIPTTTHGKNDGSSAAPPPAKKP